MNPSASCLQGHLGGSLHHRSQLLQATLSLYAYFWGLEGVIDYAPSNLYVGL